MNKDQTIKSFLTFIEANEFQDDVRICLSNKKVKAPNRLIASLLQLLGEHNVTQEILYTLKLQFSHRQKLPFELHYTDGYRSWYYENRVNGVNAFYWKGWLISISDTGKAAHYMETEHIARKCYYLGENPQLLPASFYKDYILPRFSEVNAFLKQIHGNEFFGSDWCQKEDEQCFCVEFATKQIFQTTINRSCLCGRPAVKL